MITNQKIEDDTFLNVSFYSAIKTAVVLGADKYYLAKSICDNHSIVFLNSEHKEVLNFNVSKLFKRQVHIFKNGRFRNILNKTIRVKNIYTNYRVYNAQLLHYN